MAKKFLATYGPGGEHEMLSVDDQALVVQALRWTALERMREAGGHKWSGPNWVSFRAMLRAEARRMQEMAATLEEE